MISSYHNMSNKQITDQFHALFYNLFPGSKIPPKSAPYDPELMTAQVTSEKQKNLLDGNKICFDQQE